MEDNKQNSPDEIIVDSRLSFQAALAGTAAPPVITKELCLLEVRYWSFDGRLHQGQLVVNQRLQEELADIFAIIRAALRARCYSGRFFTEEINEEVRIKRGKVKFKNGRFNEFRTRLLGVGFQVVGYPFYGFADIVS